MFSNFVKLCALTSVTLTCLGTASAQTACDSTQTACDSESDDSGDGDPVEYDEDEATDSGADDLSDADAVAGGSGAVVRRLQRNQYPGIVFRTGSAGVSGRNGRVDLEHVDPATTK